MDRCNKFIIFSCGFNCQDYITDHINSIEQQSYTNYTHILVNDNSTDSTELFITKNNKHCITNEHNQGWLHNSADYLLPEDDDIVVIVDADDMLSSKYVLELLNNIYSIEDCWMTYGSFIWSTSKVKEGKPYPVGVDYRKFEWCGVHLQTFRGFLWNNINKSDFLLEDGNYATCSYDHAVMFPILEMTPHNKQRFVPETLYVYNDNNPLHVGRLRKLEQKETANYFRSLSHYKELCYESSITDSKSK